MEPARSTRRDRLIIVFALVTLIMATYSAAGLVTYSRFYPAMNHIDVRLSAMNWHLFKPDNADPSLEINASFTVMNPESYNGLAMKSFRASLDISAPTEDTVIRQGSIIHIPISTRLDPGNFVPVVVPSFNATSEAALVANQTSNIEFEFLVDVVLRSFLDRVGEIRVSYVCQSAIGPAVCQQAEIVIITTPGASAGGGGA